MYLADILVYFETKNEHLAHLWKAFEQTRESQLRCKMKKCEFSKTQIKYLGYRIVGGIDCLWIPEKQKQLNIYQDLAYTNLY